MSQIPEWQTKKVQDYHQQTQPLYIEFIENQAAVQLTAEQEIEYNSSPIAKTIICSFLLVFILLSLAFYLLKCLRTKKSPIIPNLVLYEAVPKNLDVAKTELESHSETDSNHSSLKSE